MTLRYLVDTNVLSEPAKPKPNPHVMRRLESETGRIGMAAPVWNELVNGCSRLPPSKRRRHLERYLWSVLAPSIPILSYDARAAEWHARERARLESEGQIPPFVDGQIAAIARTNDLVLVTGNLSHYTGFEGLDLEDWTR